MAILSHKTSTNQQNKKILKKNITFSLHKSIIHYKFVFDFDRTQQLWQTKPN